MTMPITRDPLLTGARVLLALIMGACAFLAALLTLGAIAVPVFGADILAELAADSAAPVGSAFTPAASALLLGIVVLLCALTFFLLLLWRIIGSVREGDPFVPQNASRLSLMAWVALGGQILALFVDALASWVAHLAGDLGKEVEIELSISAAGVLLVLLLLILARVFRKGTDMRADLEGTV